MPRRRATTPYNERIALVFDFDKTLAPDSYDALLRRCGFEPEAFREERVAPLIDDGWDNGLARFHALTELAYDDAAPTITQDLLREVGESMEPFDGVPDMFDRLRDVAHDIHEDIHLEFYMLTCGYSEIPRALNIADEFEAIWGSEFHFDDEGRAVFAKQIITFPDKTRYLMALAKGLDPDGHDSPADVYRDVPTDEYHVPFDQMIYVGDGGSDMPSFRLMHERGGEALGVVPEESVEEWEGYDQMHEKRRVQNLAPAGYTDGDELLTSLELLVESIGKLIDLRRMSQGE